MVRRALVILLAALVLWGCAAHPGIGRGHALTARGDYRGALAAYQEALAADPDDAELHAIVDRIRPFARDQAAGDVDDALSRGAYEEAVEHARYVERLDPEMGREALDRVQHVMIATAETLFATGRPREAYPIAVRTSRLFPEARGLGATFGKLRRHFRRESDLALARGDYPGALAALDVIEHNEPALAGELAGPRRTIVVAWADALVVEGEDELARGHTGIATARFAKAYEVAGRAQDGDRMRAGLSALRELGEVQLSLVVAGDPSRNQGFEQRLVTAALAEQGVVLVDGEDGVTVGALARLAPLACTQSVSHETREQDYVAGYRDVENPAFVSLSARIADGLRHLDDLASRVERARRERQRHAGEVERCQRDDEAPADRKAEAAEAELARAEEKVERARDELRRREDELRRGQGDQAQVDRAREELRQREAEASRVRQRAQDARRDQQEAHRRCDGERQAVTRADEDLSRRRGELRGARRDLDQLESERASTPATIQEPIIETYRYDVAQHERRCQGAVVLQVERSWAGPLRREVTAMGATQDESHAAHPTIDLAEDPLVFPVDDGALRAGADESAAAEIGALLGDLTRDYYARSIDRAVELFGDDPDGATGLLLAIASVAPNQIQGAPADTVAAVLRQHHGLASLDTLRE